MIASLIDCHCIWTASAHAYRRAGLEMDGELRFPYVTAGLSVNFRKPVAIDQAIELRARVDEHGDRKSVVKCTVSSRGVLCADAQVVAVLILAAAKKALNGASEESFRLTP